MKTSPKKVAIIGGGIAGLATAYSLEEKADRKEKPISITILERDNRIGGNILTAREDGFLIEGGPDCFLSEKPWAIKLCEKLGIGNSLLCTNDEYRRTFVLWKGRLCELPEGVILMIPTRLFPFVRSNLLSFKGKVRAAMDLFIPKRRSEGDESLSEFVRRRLGQDILDKIAEPLVAGIHAGNPDTMSVKSTFPKFIKLEEEYGSLIKGMIIRRKMMHNPYLRQGVSGRDLPQYTMFMTLKGGLDELPQRIVKGMKGTTILKNKEVLSIEKYTPVIPSYDKGGNKLYKIYLKDGEIFDSHAVVFATPSYETAKILNRLNSPLSEMLNKIPYISTATVSLAYRKDSISHTMNGFGFVVPRLEKRKIMAATWVSRKFSCRSPDDSFLIKCFVGGYYNEGLVSLGDRDMVSMVREELRDIMGISADPVLTRIYRWEKAMPQYIVGHDEMLSILDTRLSGLPGIFITGSAYRGVGIPDCIHDADSTAEKVLHFLDV